MSGLTAQALKELVHHIFLPPQLPQRSDTSCLSDFVNVTLEALHCFSHASPSHKDSLKDAIALFSTSQAVHDLSENYISEPRLRAALKDRKAAF